MRPVIALLVVTGLCLTFFHAFDPHSRQQLSADAPVTTHEESASATTPATVPSVPSSNSAALSHRKSSSSNSSTDVESQGDDRYEFVMELSWVGGLNNLRGHMLQSLFYAKAWGIRTIRAGPACLKLRNMQYGLRYKTHRFLPPFDFVRLTPGKSRFALATEYCDAAAFQHLFSLPHFETTVLRVLDRTHSVDNNSEGVASSEAEKRRGPLLTAPLRILPGTSAMMTTPRPNGKSKSAPVDDGERGFYDDVIVVNDALPISWRALLDHNPLTEYKRMMKKKSEDNTIDKNGKRKKKQRILVRSLVPERLLSFIHQCPEIPGCMDLDRAFIPCAVIQKTFVDQILAALPRPFVAVHFRQFNCDKSKNQVASRVHGLLSQLVAKGSLAEQPKTLYVATGLAKEHYAAELEQRYNYTIFSKETVNSTFTTLKFPFEVMALVDFAVASQADDVVTMTGQRGSTWASFIDLARQRSGRRKVLESSKECH